MSIYSGGPKSIYIVGIGGTTRANSSTEKALKVALVAASALGAKTRLLGAEDHPAHALYKAVEDTVAGVSHACADVFGARESAEQSGFDLITTNPVPGTSGLPSLAKYAADGYSVITF